jgi:regulator of sirC expression with transglutaminase-like and TPR domain
VEATTSTFAQPGALADLLDDSSPAVRQALLDYFARHQAPAARFLTGVAHGSNRVLGRHALWYLRELRFADPVADFRRFIRSLNYELETGALLLARTVNPALDAGACCRFFDQTAARCRELISEPMSPAEKCHVISRVLFHEHGFRGNAEHYTDPRNSLLDEVIARRKGLPLTLCVVYLLVAQRLGLELYPVGVPGHFYVGCYADRAPFFIDAFRQGAICGPLELLRALRRQKTPADLTDLAPTPVREVLCRCCRNLAHHYGTAGDPEHARLFADFVAEFESTHARHAT